MELLVYFKTTFQLVEGVILISLGILQLIRLLDSSGIEDTSAVFPIESESLATTSDPRDRGLFQEPRYANVTFYDLRQERSSNRENYYPAGGQATHINCERGLVSFLLGYSHRKSPIYPGTLSSRISFSNLPFYIFCQNQMRSRGCDKIYLYVKAPGIFEKTFATCIYHRRIDSGTEIMSLYA